MINSCDMITSQRKTFVSTMPKGDIMMELDECYQLELSTYLDRTKNSRKAYEKAKQYLTGGETRSVSYYPPYPLTIDHGAGCKIYDLDGNQYYDFINNYTSLIHGHANIEVTEAITKACAKGTAVPAGIEDQVKLAELLCNRIPGVDRIRFCNSGTEATLFAVRAAKAYTGKFGLLKALGGYHGTTDMMEYNVAPTFDEANPENMCIAKPDIPGVSTSIAQDMYIMPFNDLDAAESILQKHGTKIAAIIIEPFLGAGGLIPAAPGYLQGLRSLADRYNVLLIFDEVQSLRLSEGGAQKRYDVTPDLSAFGKIIGGGLPVGGFGGRNEVMDVYNPSNPKHLTQSGTFNGNRATMAAGYAAMKLYDQTACDRLEKLAEQLESKMEKAFHELQIDGCVTRAGSLMNYHFTSERPYDYFTACRDKKDILKIMHLQLLKRGVFAAPRGTIALSTAMDESVISDACHAFYASLQALKPYL
jgi:glutamate-1-semialdehyde 2,1-aminomutase